jgi:hypothetical protein
MWVALCLGREAAVTMPGTMTSLLTYASGWV